MTWGPLGAKKRAPRAPSRILAHLTAPPPFQCECDLRLRAMHPREGLGPMAAAGHGVCKRRGRDARVIGLGFRGWRVSRANEVSPLDVRNAVTPRFFNKTHGDCRQGGPRLVRPVFGGSVMKCSQNSRPPSKRPLLLALPARITMPSFHLSRDRLATRQVSSGPLLLQA